MMFYIYILETRIFSKLSQKVKILLPSVKLIYFQCTNFNKSSPEASQNQLKVNTENIKK